MEIEELRAEVRRGEQRLRTANRDMKSMQDKAELHSKFSTQYLAELEALRAQWPSPDKRRAAAPSSNGHADTPQQAAGKGEGNMQCPHETRQNLLELLLSSTGCLAAAAGYEASAEPHCAI